MNFKRIHCLLTLVVSFFLLINCAGMFLDEPEFEEYETEHFVFYYLKGSKVENDIGKIAVESEKTVKFMNKFLRINFNLKVDGYMFDTHNDVEYVRLRQSPDATIELKTGFHVCYEQYGFNYRQTALTILHETVHIAQCYLMFSKNIPIDEGHAYYTERVYYNLPDYVENNYNFIPLISLTEEAFPEIESTPPSMIFSMTVNEFQGIDISTGERDPKYRYQIAGNFIGFVASTYGMDRLNSWLYMCDRYNFAQKFYETYSITFNEVESEWKNFVLK